MEGSGLRLSSCLPSRASLEDVVVVAIYRDKVVLVGNDFPRVAFNPREPLSKTVRRELFEQTGAFLNKSAMLGSVKLGEDEIPVYVGLVHHMEGPVLKRGRQVFRTEDAFWKLSPEWRPVRSALFYYAFEMVKRLR